MMPYQFSWNLVMSDKNEFLTVPAGTPGSDSDSMAKLLGTRKRTNPADLLRVGYRHVAIRVGSEFEKRPSLLIANIKKTT